MLFSVHRQVIFPFLNVNVHKSRNKIIVTVFRYVSFVTSSDSSRCGTIILSVSFKIRFWLNFVVRIFKLVFNMSLFSIIW